MTACSVFAAAAPPPQRALGRTVAPQVLVVPAAMVKDARTWAQPPPSPPPPLLPPLPLPLPPLATAGWLEWPVAHALDEMLIGKGLALDYFIEIEVDDEALFARIENRATKTGGARADDNAATLRRRLAVYHERTAPLLPYYAEKGVLRSVDGMNSVGKVAAQVDAILD